MVRTGCVFISYRRGADNNAAGRLHDRLESAFGRGRLFMDVDAIPPGVDFVEYLDGQVSRCEAFLAVIGPGWLAEAKRLHEPSDFVRVEVEAALRRPAIPVIPVLVDDARMPAADELPDCLHPLLRRHAIRLPHDHFAAVVDGKLKRELTRALGEAGPGDQALRDGSTVRPARRSGQARAALRRSVTIGRATLVICLAAGAAVSVRYGAELVHAGRSAIERLTGGEESSAHGGAPPASGGPPAVAPLPLSGSRDEDGSGPDSASNDADTLAAATARDPPSVRPGGLPACTGQLPPLAPCRDCPECPEMVVIPGGTFAMGSPRGEAGRREDEGPQHEVTIRPFALARTEVTFDQWRACVENDGCRRNPDPDDRGWGRGDRPMMKANWSDAQEYVAWLNSRAEGRPYRLPTEAEWEYAARADTPTPFPFGETISTEQANYDGIYVYGAGREGEYRGRTVPVGDLAADNAWGLRHMHGNVWEWVEDCWHPTYDGAPGDGSAWLAEDRGDCSRRVVRGGSWLVDPGNLRSASRGMGVPQDRNLDVGFRPARTLTAP